MNEPRSYKSEWQRKQRAAFKAINGYSTTANYGAGSLRDFVLQRDGYKCVECGMDDSAHKGKWGRPITIDHKDKNRKNNSPDNLQTLCLACHGRKDLLPELRRRKADIHKEKIMELRRDGKTYQQIADEFSFSIATAFKWVNRWEGERA